jgi:hypothetical protein
MKLGTWVGNIRHGAIRLSEEQKHQLDGIGFSWDPHAEDWEKGFKALQSFRKREGHCRASRSHIENNFKLGKWLNTQRSYKSGLSPEQISRLDSIGFSWDPRTEQWEESFAALQKFHKTEGHARVPQRLNIDGVKLGVWANLQRQLNNKGELAAERRDRLDKLGFSWDPRQDQWEEAFAALVKFRRKEGHCNINADLIFNGLKLGRWANMQRSRKYRLSTTRIKRLEDVGFNWDPHSRQWEDGFEALQKFREKEGHCYVSRSTIIEGIKLGLWVNVQRVKKAKLTPDRVKRLDNLGFSWDARVDQWEEAFAALKKFRAESGHCNIDEDVTAGGIKLASWIIRQRHFKKKGQLTTLQISRLNSIKFSWNPLTDNWEEGFTALKKFWARERHCKVPHGHIENGLQLGSWISVQRGLKKNEKLSPDRVKRMAKLGFTWDVLSEQWEQAFSAVMKFHKRERHWDIPDDHIEDGVKIGNWVGVQRVARNKGKLSQDRLMRLDAEGFSWDPRSQKWEMRFKLLEQFRKREGHCRVPQGLKIDKVNLGSWVNHLRMAKKTICLRVKVLLMENLFGIKTKESLLV